MLILWNIAQKFLTTLESLQLLKAKFSAYMLEFLQTSKLWIRFACSKEEWRKPCGTFCRSYVVRPRRYWNMGTFSKRCWLAFWFPCDHWIQPHQWFRADSRAQQLLMDDFKHWFKDNNQIMVWLAPNYSYQYGKVASILNISEHIVRQFDIFYAVNDK